MKFQVLEYPRVNLLYILATVVIACLVTGCSEPVKPETIPDGLYVLSGESPIVILPESEIQIQFIEVFDASNCEKGTVCEKPGSGTIMIGIAGPGVMPFPTELTVGVLSDVLFGYSMILTNIDRTEPEDYATLMISKQDR